MKKIVFAIQMFGLIAAFPLYVAVEFTHGVKALPASNSVAVSIEKPGQKNLQPVIESTIENENKFFVIGLKNSY